MQPFNYYSKNHCIAVLLVGALWSTEGSDAGVGGGRQQHHPLAPDGLSKAWHQSANCNTQGSLMLESKTQDYNLHTCIETYR